MLQSRSTEQVKYFISSALRISFPYSRKSPCSTFWNYSNTVQWR